MPPEYGAASQLEKIDMLDFAEFVAINKFDRKGALDALRDVAKQVQRNRQAWGKRPQDMPVLGTMAAHFNDDGVTALYQALKARLAREAQQLRAAAAMLAQAKPDKPKAAQAALELAQQREQRLDADARKLLAQWPDMQKAYAGEEYVVRIRDKKIRTRLVHTTLSGTKIRKVVLPKYEDHGELLKWLMLENVPGSFPYTAGVFAFKHEGEDPTRMFAGEGDPFRTNRRFKLLSQGMPAKRLSTAFDSVTLYGHDPDPRPDIYGKIGKSGVSVAALDDMKVLYSGFDLCAPPPPACR